MHVRLASLLVLLRVAASAAPAAHAAAPADVRMLSCDGDTTGSVTYVGAHGRGARTRTGWRFASACSRRSATASSSASPRRASASGGSRARTRRRSAGSSTIEGLQPRRRSTAWSCATAGTTTTGETILTARRRSVQCRQPAGLPNLRVAAIDIEPGRGRGDGRLQGEDREPRRGRGAERRRPPARRRRGRGRGRGDRRPRAERDSDGHLQRAGLPSAACASSSIRKS